MNFHAWTEGIPCRIGRDVTETVPYHTSWCIDVDRSRGGQDDIFTGDIQGCQAIAWWPHLVQDHRGKCDGSIFKVYHFTHRVWTH